MSTTLTSTTRSMQGRDSSSTGRRSLQICNLDFLNRVNKTPVASGAPWGPVLQFANTRCPMSLTKREAVEMILTTMMTKNPVLGSGSACFGTWLAWASASWRKKLWGFGCSFNLYSKKARLGVACCMLNLASIAVGFGAVAVVFPSFCMLDTNIVEILAMYFETMYTLYSVYQCSKRWF